MQAVWNGMAILARVARKLGPYLMLEIALPGGTLLALLLFLARRGKLFGSGDTGEWAPLKALCGIVDFGRRQTTR
jgi:hypothetical protein